MSRGSLFWMLMILLFLGVIGPMFYPEQAWVRFGSSVFAFVLIGLLGWEVYGPAVKGK